MDQLRVVHDVFGHAALGVGFDLQYIVTGQKPGLCADLPPPELLAACD